MAKEAHTIWFCLLLHGAPPSQATLASLPFLVPYSSGMGKESPPHSSVCSSPPGSSRALSLAPFRPWLLSRMAVTILSGPSLSKTLRASRHKLRTICMCVSVPLKCSIKTRTSFYLPRPHELPSQYLAHSRCPINICWVTRQMNDFSAQNRARNISEV